MRYEVLPVVLLECYTVVVGQAFPEHEGIIILWNAWNYSPGDTSSHPRRFHSSKVGLLFLTRISSSACKNVSHGTVAVVYCWNQIFLSFRSQDRWQLHLYLHGRLRGTKLQQAILSGTAVSAWGQLWLDRGGKSNQTHHKPQSSTAVGQN